MNILDSNSYSQELLQRRQQSKLEYLIDEIQTLQSQNDVLQARLLNYQSNQMDQVFSEELQLLQQQVIQLSNQNTQSKTQAFLNLQMNQQIESFYIDIVHEQDQKIQELRRIIHDKEYTIQQQEKCSTFINDGVAIKCKDLIQLSEVSLKMHNEILNLQAELLKSNTFIQSCNEKITQLQSENNIYKFEINKIKKVLMNQMSYYKIRQAIVQNETFSDTETDSVKRLTSATCETHQPQSFFTPKCSDLERYKKLFDSQVITNRILQQEYNKIYQQNQQLLITNERLCNQIQSLNKKIDKLKADSIYLEQHWNSCMLNNSLTKYYLKYEQKSPSPTKSCKQLLYQESNSMKEYKNYLLQMHRSLHTVKQCKLNLPKHVSEPPRGRIVLLEKKKKIKKVLQHMPISQDISIIHKRDISQISEYIF